MLFRSRFAKARLPADGRSRPEPCAQAASRKSRQGSRLSRRSGFPIGETEAENEAGKTEEVCARQIDAVLKTQGAAAFEGAVIAYEPVWAIGTGKSATPAQAQAVHKFIRDHIAKVDANIAEQVIIQYGGSVNASNAAELFAQPDIDGALVGGASLKADAFAVIVKAAEAAKQA